MGGIPVLTEDQIRAWISEPSYSRGVSYFRNDAIFSERRQGMTLKAHCEGSQADSYRLWATLGEEGILSADCSCPVGGGGHCKHVAALLLTWRSDPDRFAEVEELDPALQRRSKEDLIALIRQMLEQEPDLEVLLETPPPGGPERMPVSPETYRRQAETILRRSGRHGGYHERFNGATAELEALVRKGDGFVGQGDYARASAVYMGAVQEVLGSFEEVQDDEGEIAGIVGACARGLGTCLEGEKQDSGLRKDILDALFAIYVADVSHGGIGLADDVPDALVEHTNAEERRQVASWVRDVLARAKGGDSSWARGCYASLLLDLEGDALDDESHLQICRDAGLTGALVDRLLERNRLEEAVAQAERAKDCELLTMADLLSAHGHGPIAERLVVARAAVSQDGRLLEWLKKRYADQGDVSKTLDVAEELFGRQPSFRGYQETRELARQLDVWDTLRPELMALLQAQRSSDVLVQVYLDEGEIDLALEATRTTPTVQSSYGYAVDLRLKVAEAAEESRPRAALGIYREYAEAFIERRNRSAYQTACAYLKKMRGLYERLDEGAQWAAYMARVRQRYPTLRAFQEEATHAGL